LGLERSYYLNSTSEKNSKAIEMYKKAMVYVLNSLYGVVKNANEEVEKLFELETRLASIMRKCFFYKL
jgi:hypothetical protein